MIYLFICIVPSVDSIIDSSLITQFGDAKGSAVAISNCLALTAFHGICDVGDQINVITRTGKTRLALVVFVAFERDVVDIAVVKLVSIEDKFDFFVPPCMSRVRLEQSIHVVGLRETSRYSVDPYSIISNVLLIESESTLFHTSYYNFDGCSGTGVITTGLTATLLPV